MGCELLKSGELLPKVAPVKIALCVFGILMMTTPEPPVFAPGDSSP
jgi:hypothetical protein